MMLMKVAIDIDMDDDDNVWICFSGQVDDNNDDDDLMESLKQDQNLVGIVINDIIWQDEISMLKDYHNIDNDEIDWWCF